MEEYLNFNNHIGNAVNKASRKLSLIRKTFILLDETTVPNPFTAMEICKCDMAAYVQWRQTKG